MSDDELDRLQAEAGAGNLSLPAGAKLAKLLLTASPIRPPSSAALSPPGAPPAGQEAQRPPAASPPKPLSY